MLALPTFPKTTLPGPRRVPLLGRGGNLLRFFGDPVGAMLDLHARYGDLCALTGGDAAMLCAFGAEWNQQVLADNKGFFNFSDMLFPVAANSSITRLNNALTSMNGEQHRRQRRMLMPAFTKAAVDGYRDEMARVTARVLDGWKPGVRDIRGAMVDLTMRIALACLFGLDPADRAGELGALSMALLDGFTSPLVMMLPYNLPGLPYARLEKNATRLEALIRSFLVEKRAQLAQLSKRDVQAAGSSKDMLAILLAAHDEDGSALTDDELLGQSNVLFIAGHETTAYTLVWTLLLLAQHPDVANALGDELAPLQGRAPTAEEASKLPLLDAVLKESMRLLPTTPFLFIRVAQSDFQLGSHALPKGAQLILSPLVTHRDPSLFPEPKRFLPSRWSGLQPSPYQYLPFGAGPRMCIGAGFAQLALRVTLPMLVQRFRFTVPDGTAVSRKVRGITLGPKNALPMQVLSADRAWRKGRLAGDLGELVQFA